MDIPIGGPIPMAYDIKRDIQILQNKENCMNTKCIHIYKIPYDFGVFLVAGTLPPSEIYFTSNINQKTYQILSIFVKKKTKKVEKFKANMHE